MSDRAWWDAFALAWLAIGLHFAGELYTGRGRTENVIAGLRKFKNQRETLRKVTQAAYRRNRRIEALEYFAKVEVGE